MLPCALHSLGRERARTCIADAFHACKLVYVCMHLHVLACTCLTLHVSLPAVPFRNEITYAMAPNAPGRIPCIGIIGYSFMYSFPVFCKNRNKGKCKIPCMLDCRIARTFSNPGLFIATHNYVVG